MAVIDASVMGNDHLELEKSVEKVPGTPGYGRCRGW